MTLPTDQDLLAQYRDHRDQAAFGELVRRHGAMVHAAGRRLAGADDADDVTQAVFLLLARKAAALSRHTSLAGWLYRTARYCATNARRSRLRREARLYAHQEAAMNASSTSRAGGPAAIDPHAGMADVLDDGLRRLRAGERRVVLLRYFEGLSLDETARQTGVSSAAVAKRAQRGLAKLRTFLVARGYAEPAATASAVATALASQAGRLSESVLAGVAHTASAGTVSANAAGLASAAQTAMTLARAKVAALLLVAFATATVATTLAVNRPATTKNTVAMTAPAAPAAVSAPSAPPATTASTRSSVEIGIAPDAAGAQLAAEKFLLALRDRDATAAADLLIGPDPPARLAVARRLIAEIRDGAYARYPQRLGMVTQNSFMSNADGGYIEATKSVDTPTLAEIRHCVLHLKPVDGQWRVQHATLTEIDASFVNYAPPPPATLPANRNVAPGTYSRAPVAAQRLFEGVDFDESDMTDAKKSELLARVRDAQDQVSQLAAALRPTDMAMDDASVARVRDALGRLSDVLDKRGASAFRTEAKRLTGSSPQLAVDLAKLAGLPQRLAALADAEDEAAAKASKGDRPPSFGMGLALTFAWDESQHNIQGPLRLPEWLVKTAAWRTWDRVHDIRRFRTTDDDGNVYDVSCMGAVDTGGGKIVPMIPTIRQYRPDGTLSAMAQFDGQGRATSWGTFDPSGKRWAYRVTTRSNEHGESYVTQVSFFDQEGNQRLWRVKPTGVVWREETTDPIGGQAKTVNSVQDVPDVRP